VAESAKSGGALVAEKVRRSFATGAFRCDRGGGLAAGKKIPGGANADPGAIVRRNTEKAGGGKKNLAGSGLLFRLFGRRMFGGRVMMVMRVMLVMMMVVMVMVRNRLRSRLRSRLGGGEAWRRGKADNHRRGDEYILDHSIPQFFRPLDRGSAG
jgi:hypothetical protein